MFLIADVLLIHVIEFDLLFTVRGSEELQEIPLELHAVVVNVLLGIFAD
jgi:hypothetical protein